MKIYSNMGKGIDFIENYCNDHKSFAGVRRYYVDKCLEYNEYDKAIATLKESIKLDKEYPSIVESHMRTLKNIYKDLGEKEKYRDILWDMVTRNSIGDIDCYKELKLLYDEEQWKVKREKIFSSLKESNYLGEIYAEEKLYDKLLKYAVNRQDIYEIQKYKEMLMDKFPKEVLNKYGRELDKMAAEVSSRKYYKKIAVILTSLLEIKGGKDYVKNKIEEYKLAYPRRKAMIEELNYVPVNG